MQKFLYYCSVQDKNSRNLLLGMKEFSYEFRSLVDKMTCHIIVDSKFPFVMEKDPIREPIYTELFSHCSSIESVTDSQIVSLKKDQQMLNEQMRNLQQKLQEIALHIPQDELDDCITQVDGICNRLEACWSRIQNVNKRADKLIQILGGAPPSVTQQISNKISNFISKDSK